ncbi:uncharacterized protein A4U43_C07F18020 [Asparagus officinalis]|uniref:Uncharacterized protein n=1 Tax=Asparagus officinalis TaxID=4686 RepID=A0A5P1ED11_ASPOF|nr:uncharacterized protein A4U43_C07F18020 [Asparagus officinalis]
MTFLEEQFRLLLEDSRIKVPASASRKPPHWSQDSDSSSTFSPSAPKDPNGCEDEISPPPFPPEIIGRLHRSADAMISQATGLECLQLSASTQRFEEGLSASASQQHQRRRINKDAMSRCKSLLGISTLVAVASPVQSRSSSPVRTRPMRVRSSLSTAAHRA